jgi:hypothetical protein
MKKLLLLSIILSAPHAFSSSVSDAIQDQIDQEISLSSQKIYMRAESTAADNSYENHSAIEESNEQEEQGLIQIIGDVIEHGQNIMEDPRTQEAVEVVKTKGPKVIQFFKNLLCAGKTGADDEPKKPSKKKKKKEKK